MRAITIIESDLSDQRLFALIKESNAHSVANSPPGKSYEITPEALGIAQMRYWLALEEGAAAGCVGLKPLARDHGEVKSLLVADAHRGKGLATLLMAALINAARPRGLTRLSLETGSSQGYAAARRFYHAAGFARCEPFGEYLNDGVSYCMTRVI